MMQLSGTALRIPYPDLRKAFLNFPEIHSRMLEFVQQQAVMVGQIAGCNRLHGSEQRLIRWLLTAQDRTQSSDLLFTHQYLADMIASQRTTVTAIARDLQERGFISYSRGIVRILDREGLEKAACDCYAITKLLYTRLYARRTMSSVSS
jgi:CRP-like cAMP-binding protein